MIVMKDPEKNAHFGKTLNSITLFYCSFRMWMNSVCSSMKCLSLFSESFRTGYQLLEVVESMEPNSIDWSITFKPPFKPIVKRIKSVENCNQVKESKETFS